MGRSALEQSPRTQQRLVKVGPAPSIACIACQRALMCVCACADGARELTECRGASGCSEPSAAGTALGAGPSRPRTGLGGDTGVCSCVCLLERVCVYSGVYVHSMHVCASVRASWWLLYVYVCCHEHAHGGPPGAHTHT